MLRRGVRHVVTTMAIGTGCIALGTLGALLLLDLPRKDALPIVVAAVAACGVLGLATVSLCAYDVLRTEWQRGKYVEFARRNGWRFFNRSNEYTGRFSLFPFNGSAEDYQMNIVQGTFSGAQCAAFTYVRVIQTEERGEVQEPYHVALAELPVFLPRLELVPERLADKFAASIAGDLDVESYHFNRRWRVIYRDPRYAHAVLHPRMIERLLKHDALKYSLLIDGGAVLMWRPGRRGTRSLTHRLGVLSAVARLIPEHVVREYREPGPGNAKSRADRGRLTPPGEARAPRLTAFDIFDDASFT